jgi:hypothetical protein
MSEPNTPEMDWDKATFQELWRLANDVPAAGVHVKSMTVYTKTSCKMGLISEAQIISCSKDTKRPTSVQERGRLT